LVDGSSQTERNFPILLLTVVEAIEVTMMLTANSKKLPLILCFFFFESLLIKSHKNRQMSPTIHHKYKYFHSAVQTVEDRRIAVCCKRHAVCKVLWESLESGGNREITIASQYGWIGLA